MLRAAPGAGHQAGTTTTVREVVEMARYDLPECNNIDSDRGYIGNLALRSRS